MPQVLSDQSLTTVITNTGTDLFQYPSVSRPSVLGLQVPPTQPLPPGTAAATNLLAPDLQAARQLANFPPGSYDLAPSSLLSHLMQALLGAGGTGQLRKRQLVARLQQAVTSTRFYDLDSLYGALFGAQRGPDGALPVSPATGQPVSPYADLASPDGWDAVEAADAVFRERVIALARAITLGGTVPGIRALAEAVTGAPCQVHEAWRLLDNAEGPAPGFQTWAQVAVQYPAWSAFPATQTWQGVEGFVIFAGLLANGAPNEVIITPAKHYSSSQADLARQGADYFGILSVAEVLKPAASVVSVSQGGPVVLSPVVIGSAWSPSQYWEVVTIVTPSAPGSPAYAAVASSYQGPGAGALAPGTWVTPSPPLSRSSGFTCSYAADVTSVTSRAVTGDDPNQVTVTDGRDFQSVAFPGGQPAPPGAIRLPGSGGTVLEYLPSQAVMPPQAAASARSASPVAVKAAPYSGPRVPVSRAS